MMLSEIENAIRKLSPGDLAHFREWFLRFEEHGWDRQFEADVAGGRLDSMAEIAIREHRAGRYTSG